MAWAWHRLDEADRLWVLQQIRTLLQCGCRLAMDLDQAVAVIRYLEGLMELVMAVDQDWHGNPVVVLQRKGVGPIG